MNICLASKSAIGDGRGYSSIHHWLEKTVPSSGVVVRGAFDGDYGASNGTKAVRLDPEPRRVPEEWICGHADDH